MYVICGTGSKSVMRAYNLPQAMSSTSVETKRGPLEGITVLDFTRAMSGPFCTMLLGDLGANVIKVEPEKGDDTRAWAPPEIKGMSTYFMSANRNKLSVALDLTKEKCREIVKRLALQSDIVVENFRPGVAEKLGIDYSTLSAYNSRLVYCSISGFGQTGPYREKPGFDLTVLAVSGLMSLTGEEGRPPVKFGVPISDITAGLFASVAILSALFSRSETGRGQYIDMSMLDANMLTLTHQATSYFATGKNPERLGSAHASIAPYQVYATSDGYVSVAVGSEKLWKEFCAAIGMKEMLDVPELLTNPQRVRNRKLLNSMLEPAFARLKTSEAVSRLESAGVPVAAINSMSDLVSDPQVKARRMIGDISHPAYGSIKSIGSPFALSETPGTVRLAPPLLGEHTIQMLRSLRFTEEEINSLLTERAVFSH